MRVLSADIYRFCSLFVCKLEAFKSINKNLRNL